MECYFDKLFNASHEDDIVDLNVPVTENPQLHLQNQFFLKLKQAHMVFLQKYGCALRRLEAILKFRKTPNDQRKSILVPIIKNIRDVQSCANYYVIKLMSNTIKLWERVIECRLRGITKVSEDHMALCRQTYNRAYLFSKKINVNIQREEKGSAYGIH